MQETVDQAMMRARSHETRGKPDVAIEIYRTILDIFPGNRRARAALTRLETGQRKAAAEEPSQEVLREVIGLHQQGDHAAAIQRASELLKRFPSSAVLWNVLGAAKLAIGQLVPAESAFRKAVQLNRESPEPLTNLGNALKARGKIGEAIASYRQALSLAPDYPIAHNNLGNILKDRGKLGEAAACYRRAIKTAPLYDAAHNNLGNVLKDQNRPDEAIACYRKALEINPRYDAAYNNLANVMKDEGRIAEAVEAYEAAIAARPNYAEAHRNLSTIKRYQPGDPQVEVMLRLHREEALDNSGMSHLCLALSKAFEDIGDIERSFAFLQEGNARRKRQLGYDISQDEVMFANIRAGARELAGIRVTEPAGQVRPIFILGMPRSGTTLVEQIVCSHSQVAGGGELQHLGQWFRPRMKRRQPATLQGLAEIRGKYLAALRPLAGGLAHVTDKMPHNFRWLGQIAAAFPEAAIIHVDRDPRAVCWSNYKHFFTASGLGYSCDLADTVAYYRLYRDLMALWYDGFGDRIYRLDYDALTEDQEGETRKLIAHVGLPWEDTCLEPHENTRSVKTASQQQVRTRVYKGSSQGWRKFEPYIGGAFDGI